MQSFTYKCISIGEVCRSNNLDLTTVMDSICSSSISFGSNYDTLITTSQLERILEKRDVIADRLNWDNHDEDNILISLGS